MNINNFKKTAYNEPFILQRADPFVTRTPEGTYLFTASVPEYDRIALRAASTLDGLKDAEETVVWTKHEKGIMSQHIWAPEIHLIGGRWYIYFAASDVDDIWALRPYVLGCRGDDPMNDPWEELGQMQASSDDPFSFNDFSLDMTVFEVAGIWYCVWAEKVNIGKKISNLYIAELESPTRLKTSQVLLSAPDYDWERYEFWVNEGPGLLRHDGRVFLTYSASSTGMRYCVGLLSAKEGDDLTDPALWHKERYPVLQSDVEKGMIGPGHNSFTKLPDGTDVMIYHARQYDEIEGDPLYDPNRHAYRMRIEWDESTGYPVFDIGNNF